jgi:hypothetical protein
MLSRLRAWLKPQPHPTTGDLLAPSERVTWAVMRVYRRWTVFLLLQALTAAWWLFPHAFPGGLPGWNYVWSDLAVIVEMMVGISFLGQAMRDAVVIRKELAELREDTRLLRAIADHLGVDTPGADS